MNLKSWIRTLFVLAGLVACLSGCLSAQVLDRTRHSQGYSPKVKSILGATASEQRILVGVEDDHGARSVYAVNPTQSSSIAIYQYDWKSVDGGSTWRETSSRKIELPEGGDVLEPRVEPDPAAAPPFDPRNPISVCNDHGEIEVRDLKHPESTCSFELAPVPDSSTGTDVLMRILMLPLTFALDVVTFPVQLIYWNFCYPD